MSCYDLGSTDWPRMRSSKMEGYRLVRILYPKKCHVILVVSDDCILGFGGEKHPSYAHLEDCQKRTASCFSDGSKWELVSQENANHLTESQPAGREARPKPSEWSARTSNKQSSDVKAPGKKKCMNELNIVEWYSLEVIASGNRPEKKSRLPAIIFQGPTFKLQECIDIYDTKHIEVILIPTSILEKKC